MTAKTLIDYFLPMEPQGPLVSKGVWGDSNVLPRDIHNGLEDARLERRLKGHTRCQRSRYGPL